MSSLSKSTHSMGDRHYLHTLKYRQQKTRRYRYRYHPHTEPTTASSSKYTLRNRDSTQTLILPRVVMNDEEDKSWERHGEGHQYQFLTWKIGTHSPYDMKTPRSTFEKREESPSIFLEVPIDPAMTLESSSSIDEKPGTKVRVLRNTFHRLIQKNFRTWTSRESRKSTTRS